MTERSQPAQLPSKESHFKALAKEFIKADEQQNGSLPVNLQIAINQFARWLDERSSHETGEYCDRRRHNFVKLPGGIIATCTYCNRPEPPAQKASEPQNEGPLKGATGQ